MSLSKVKNESKKTFQHLKSSVLQIDDGIPVQYLAVSTILISSAVSEFTFSSTIGLTGSEISSIRWSALLLLIAGVHYGVLATTNLDRESQMYIRYMDWLLTTPMLILSIISLYPEVTPQQVTHLIALDIGMIVSGFYYEVTKTISYWYLGTACYIALVVYMYELLGNVPEIVNYIIWGWMPYGAISLVSLESRPAILYSCLDIYNKYGLANTLRQKILLQLETRKLQKCN